MNKIRISAVSYTNTKPFVYGLNHSGILKDAELSLENPSDCAQKLIDNQADIGLVPVAALLHIPSYSIISDYCISADGAVNSVFIFSDVPVEEIKTIRLDRQSRTSNNLAKVLVKFYWKLAVNFDAEDERKQPDAFVQIGDRTFGKKNKYAYVYDLAEEWQNFTGLPFVFAVWAANKIIDQDFISRFNTALKYGLDHRKTVIQTLPQPTDFDLDDYLMHRISYRLDDRKREALNMFLEMIGELDK